MKNSNLTIINHASDIDTALLISSKISRTKIITFNPEIYNYLSINNIDVNLIEIDEAEDTTKTWSLANEFCKQTRDDLRNIRNTSNKYIDKWIYWDLVWMFRLLINHNNITKDLINRYKDSSIYIPCPNVGYEYGAHSYLPATNQAHQLHREGIKCTLVNYEISNQLNLIHPDLDNLKALASIKNSYNLVSLPTVFYDFDLYSNIIKKSGIDCIYLTSQKYEYNSNNMQQTGIKFLKNAILPDEFLLHQELVDILHRNTEKFIFSDQHRISQSEYFSNSILRKLRFYEQICEILQKHKPKQIYICFHEAGITGPLLSAAKDLDINTVIFPHSKVINYRIPIEPNNNFICLTHPLQGTRILSIDGEPFDYKYINFNYSPAKFSDNFGENHFTISILETGLSAGGAPDYRASKIVEASMFLFQELNKYNIRIMIRHRTNQNLLATYKNYGATCFNHRHQSEESLDHFLSSATIAITIGAPTSALYRAIELNIPSIHILTQPLCEPEQGLLDPAIVPQINLSNSIDLIARILLDANYRNELIKLQVGTLRDRLERFNEL